MLVGAHTPPFNSARTNGPQFSLDSFQDGIGCRQHLVVPEADNPEAWIFKSLRTKPVCILLEGVLSAVNFNNEVRFQADEIDNERRDWILTSKLEPSELAIAQPRPDASFCLRLCCSEIPECRLHR
jgi:hypothetical protein